MLSLVNAINAQELGTLIQFKSVNPAGLLCLYGPQSKYLHTKTLTEKTCEVWVAIIDVHVPKSILIIDNIWD